MGDAAFKKVTARGKRYVYLRGSNVAIVRGFLGADAELDTLLASPEILRAVESDGIVFDVQCCSVPMAIGPEVRYSLSNGERA